MNAVSATATRPEQAASAFPVRRDATTSVGVGFAEVLGPERSAGVEGTFISARNAERARRSPEWSVASDAVVS